MKKKNRNAMIVGHNRASYDDKHPHNPVALRPLHIALKSSSRTIVRRVRAMCNLSRPEINQALRYL